MNRGCLTAYDVVRETTLHTQTAVPTEPYDQRDVAQAITATMVAERDRQSLREEWLAQLIVRNEQQRGSVQPDDGT